MSNNSSHGIQHLPGSNTDPPRNFLHEISSHALTCFYKALRFHRVESTSNSLRRGATCPGMTKRCAYGFPRDPVDVLEWNLSYMVEDLELEW